MHQAAKAYGAIAQKTANPRELEADLLLSAAARLQSVHENWNGKQSELEAALVNNRRLWSIFMTSVTSSENPLPAIVRQNVANLGIFVQKHTLNTLAAPTQKAIATLIRINREVAAGLLGRTG